MYLQVQQCDADQLPSWGSHLGGYRQAWKAQMLGNCGKVSDVAA